MRQLVAAGAAVLVMGLGGNLYATSYKTSDTIDFGPAPPWGAKEVDARTFALHSDHGSYKWNGNIAAFDHFGLNRERAARETKKVGKADRSRRNGDKTWPKTISTLPVVPCDTPTSVPDGGLTLLMLGGTLCGLAVLRRRTRL